MRRNLTKIFSFLQFPTYTFGLYKKVKFCPQILIEEESWPFEFFDMKIKYKIWADIDFLPKTPLMVNNLEPWKKENILL